MERALQFEKISSEFFLVVKDCLRKHYKPNNSEVSIFNLKNVAHVEKQQSFIFAVFYGLVFFFRVIKNTVTRS